MHKVLLVDDEIAILEALQRTLKAMPIEIFIATNGEKALKLVREENPDVVLTDLKMPGMNGLELIKSIKAISHKIQCVMITGFATIDDAINAMKFGAYDFLPKPFKSHEIKLVMNRVLEKVKLLKENSSLKEQLTDNKTDITWGKSDAFKNLYQKAKQAALSDATILILGESGTGKEVLANYVYDNSKYNDKPFIKLNCAAIPENLLESELFGHKKGSFTGAISDSEGKFAEADGGSIFLDEIGELPLSIQSKLLRVLQEGEINPIGGKVRKVNVRIIAATNKNLLNQVKDGKFREDLYYRLNVIPLSIPSLRERVEDIPGLVNHFLKKYSTKNDRKTPKLTNNALQLLESYDWPGNIRELENVIERTIILTLGDEISEFDLPEEINIKYHQANNDNILEGKTMEEIELMAINRSLKKHKGDKKKVAEDLQISLRTIYRKLDKKYILQ